MIVRTTVSKTPTVGISPGAGADAPTVGISPGADGGGGAAKPPDGISPARADAESTHIRAIVIKKRFIEVISFWKLVIAKLLA